MLTQYNTLNWVRFLRHIIDDKECKQKIKRFIYSHYNKNNRYTSYLMYNRYCK